MESVAIPEYRRFAAPPVIQAALAAALVEYRGRWVTVDNGSVVASGDSAPEVLARALELHVNDPLVFSVPAHPGRPRFSTW